MKDLVHRLITLAAVAGLGTVFSGHAQGDEPLGGEANQTSGVFPGPIPSPPAPFAANLTGASAIPPNNSPLSASGAAGLIAPSPFGPYAWWIYVSVGFPISQITNHPDIYPAVASVQNQDGSFVTDPGCMATNPCPFLLAPPLPPIGPPGCNGCVYPPIVILPPTYVDARFAVTAEQLLDLEAGQWYVNVTFATTNGRPLPDFTIRGQILPVDRDGDGVPDYLDQCPNTPPGIVDAHGCSVEQLCPCDGPWKSHGEYVTCVTTTIAQFYRDGIIAEAERRNLVNAAIRSDCGKRGH